MHTSLLALRSSLSQAAAASKFHLYSVHVLNGSQPSNFLLLPQCSGQTSNPTYTTDIYNIVYHCLKYISKMDHLNSGPISFELDSFPLIIEIPKVVLIPHNTKSAPDSMYIMEVQSFSSYTNLMYNDSISYSPVSGIFCKHNKM